MLNQEEEAKFNELKDKCRELKVPPPMDIFIGFKVHDKNGILIFDDLQRGHSWTRNFYNGMFGSCACACGDGGSSFGAGYMSGKNTGGSTGAMTYTPMALSSVNLLSTGGYQNIATDATSGIVIGTGDTAFSAEHYTLASLIDHGNGSGQMYYQAMATKGSANIPTYTSSPKAWQQVWSRIFNNNSGASITVKETGLYWKGYLLSTNNLVYMMERSVLDPTVAVANGAQLTVTYTISMDFSAID